MKTVSKPVGHSTIKSKLNQNKHAKHDSRPNTFTADPIIKKTVIQFSPPTNTTNTLITSRPGTKSRPSTKSRPETAVEKVISMQYQIERLAGITGDYQPKVSIRESESRLESIAESGRKLESISSMSSDLDMMPLTRINDVPASIPTSKYGRIYILSGRIYQPSESFQQFMSHTDPLYTSKFYFMEKLEEYVEGTCEVSLDAVMEIINVPGWFERLDGDLFAKCLINIEHSTPRKMSELKAAVIIQKIYRGWLCRRRFDDYKKKQLAGKRIVKYLKKRIKDRKRLEEFQLGLEKSVMEVEMMNQKFGTEWSYIYQTQTLVIVGSKFSPGLLTNLLNPKLSIILLTPKISDSDKLFMKKLLNIHLNYANLISSRRLVIIEVSIPAYLNPRTGLTQTILLNPSLLSNVKALLKSKNGVLFPIECTKDDSRLCLLLNIPLFGAINLPASINNLVNGQSHEENRRSIYYDILPNHSVEFVAMSVNLGTKYGVNGMTVHLKCHLNDELHAKVALETLSLAKSGFIGACECGIDLKDKFEVNSNWTGERDLVTLLKYVQNQNLSLADEEEERFSIVLRDIYIEDLRNVFLETLDTYFTSHGFVFGKDGLGIMVRRQTQTLITIIATDLTKKKCAERIVQALLILKFGFVTNSNHNLAEAAKQALKNSYTYSEDSTLEEIAAGIDSCNEIFELEKLKDKILLDTVNSNKISTKSIKLLNTDHSSLDLRNLDPDYGKHQILKKSPSKSKSIPVGQFTPEEYVSLLESQDKKRNPKKKQFI